MFPEQSQHMRWRMHCGQDSQHRMQDASSGKQNSVFHYWVRKHKYVFSKSRDCPRTCAHPGLKKITLKTINDFCRGAGWIAGGCPIPAPLWTPLDLKHIFFQNWGIRTESKQDNKQTGHGVGSLPIIDMGGNCGGRAWSGRISNWPGRISNGAPGLARNNIKRCTNECPGQEQYPRLPGWSLPPTTGPAPSPLINLETQHDGRSARIWLKRV